MSHLVVSPSFTTIALNFEEFSLALMNHNSKDHFIQEKKSDSPRIFPPLRRIYSMAVNDRIKRFSAGMQNFKCQTANNTMSPFFIRYLGPGVDAEQFCVQFKMCFHLHHPIGSRSGLPKVSVQ